MGPEIDEGGKRVWREKDKMSDDIRTYRAEWNVWAYYCEFTFLGRGFGVMKGKRGIQHQALLAGVLTLSYRRRTRSLPRPRPRSSNPRTSTVPLRFLPPRRLLRSRLRCPEHW